MQISKLKKSDLSYITSIHLTMSDALAMAISDYMDSIRTDEMTLSFLITPTAKQVPYLKPEDYSLVIREKVDLSATGPYERTIADEDKDVGQHNYKNKYPYRPRGLTSDFIELKGENS